MLHKRRVSIVTGLLVLSLIFGMIPVAAPEAMADSRKTIVGIAWREDTDSEFYTNICTALTEAGAEPVLLDMVVDEDLLYSDGRIDACGVTEEGFLTDVYAALVKRNTYSHSNAADVVRGIDAVVFTGGEDISPTLYAGQEERTVTEIDFNATRDVSDYLLMAYCIDNDIPVMGFCRGMQMLAVVSGASMIQDIPVFYAENELEYHYGHRNETSAGEDYRDYAPHDIQIIDPDSRTYTILGEASVANVPSWHHQAVKSTEGTKLKVTAIATMDGYDIIEAIERTDKTMILGFQFHPEAAIAKRLNRSANADAFMSMEEALRIFTGLIEHCQKEAQIAA